jgi:WD40 repeat protein
MMDSSSSSVKKSGSDTLDEDVYRSPRDSVDSPSIMNEEEFYDTKESRTASPQVLTKKIISAVPSNVFRPLPTIEKRPSATVTTKKTDHSPTNSDGEKSTGEGMYINLKAFSGLTSPPVIKRDSLQDDISSLSSFSAEGEGGGRKSEDDSSLRDHSKETTLEGGGEGGVTVKPDHSFLQSSSHLNALSSGAMKLFKNVDGGAGGGGGNDDMDDDNDPEEQAPPPSKPPEKYDFNYQSMRIKPGTLNIPGSVPEGIKETTGKGNDEDEDEEDEEEEPVGELSHLNISNTGNTTNTTRASSSPTRRAGRRHNSLKRRSVKLNEELLLSSALFGLNEFQASMQGGGSSTEGGGRGGGANNASGGMNSSTATTTTMNNHHSSSSAANLATSQQQQQPQYPQSTSDLFKEKIRLAQTLQGHEGPIWSMKISPNGQYLATGGQDTRVLVWCIVSLPKSTRQFSMDSTDGSQPSSHNSHDDLTGLNNSDNEAGNRSSRGSSRARRSSAGDFSSLIHPFLHSEPYRVYEGHTHDITDLSWSKSNFLLSSSMDKTVRLWHASRNDCLQYFRHPDIVTCVEFHPLHDRFFVSGCFDRRLRVWDIIPTGNVREWVSANDTVSLSCPIFVMLS